ncbi:uncharacterized protein A4U43_C10F6600, partial [Asparagus officinalis]
LPPAISTQTLAPQSYYWRSISGWAWMGSSESPEEPKKGRSKTPKKTKESVLKQKSPVEFFVENKNIAGFDN